MAKSNDLDKQNCWEHFQCGREPGGYKVDELGPCPAATDNALDGINDGDKGGRLCWAVAGTLCDAEHGKEKNCMDCSFFQKVQEAEDAGDLRTKFLRFVTLDGKRPLVEGLTFKHVSAGERFITQGDPGEAAYIIQKGSCKVEVEKDGKLLPAGRYGLGDVVGITALLTGAPYSAHVEAESAMCLWVIPRADFEAMVESDPDLMEFLTELVTTRLDGKRPVADRVIGKYTAREVLGKGGFSVVYKGVHNTLEMPVVIKMLHHDKALDQDFLAAFRNEAEVIAKLNHENIVRVYDIEELYRTVFIVMELLEGELLSDLVMRLGKIPSELAANFIIQACQGLDYAHERGIIHRDINTSNLFVLSGDRLKILDFGLACTKGTEDFGASGTAAFMAPEQIEGDPVDERTDIYSLGLAAYEMVTGQRAFPGNDIQWLLNAHLTQDVADPEELVEDIPEPLRAMILKAGKSDPEERYQSTREIVEELSQLMPECVLPPVVESPARRMTTLFLIYDEGRQEGVASLTEEFSAKLRDAGVVVRAADFKDI